jgi:predicted nucleic acid-binding protein
MPNGKMSCFVDTNLIVYAMDRMEPAKHRLSSDLLRRIVSEHTLVFSPQSLNECYHALAVRRRVATVAEVRRFIWSLSDFCTAPYDFMTTQLAWAIADRYGFSWWDCMLLASASQARCEIFFSEDMQHRAHVGAMIILSPFRLEPGFNFTGE